MPWLNMYSPNTVQITKYTVHCRRLNLNLFVNVDYRDPAGKVQQELPFGVVPPGLISYLMEIDMRFRV
jgi:hypothetical protein